MKNQYLLDRITTNPDVMVGKPVIKGTRLTVDFILNLLADGITIPEILEEYERLIEEDIRACLLSVAYYIENSSFISLLIESR
jgi:uncharacterized protein (DUF433 family)